MTFDAAGNRGAPVNVSVALPDAEGTATGVAPNSDTVEPSPDLVRSVVDNGDGTVTLTVGTAPTARGAKAGARWRIGSAQVSGTPVAGQNQCDYFGFQLSGGQPGSTLVRPFAGAPYGLMQRNTVVQTDISGSYCKVTGPRATIDEAYKTFDRAWVVEGSAVGPRYSGDVGYADKAKLPFGCTASSGATFSATADFSDISGRADIKWTGSGTPSVEVSVTAKPTFTLEAKVSGNLTCTPSLGKGLFLPLGSTPLVLELKPEATVTIDASVDATLTFRPTLTLSTTQAKNHLTVPAPVLSGAAEATLDAGLYLNASLMVAGVAGIEGKIGPHLTAPLTSPFCGDLSIHASLALKVDVLFRNWTQPLASGDFAHTKVGDCPGLDGSVQLGPSGRGQSLDAELDETGQVLLHDYNCYGRTTVRATNVTTSVGDDAICFTNDMTSDAKAVMYPQYSRKNVVPQSQVDCPDPQGYMYRWDRATKATAWIDLGGACHYQAFKVSDNGRWLAVLVDESGGRLLLRDLETGSTTEIAPPCEWCAPRGVSDDGSRVVYDGRTQLVTRDGDVVDGATEAAVYVWERGVGSMRIAGGGAATDDVRVLSTSRDARTVAFSRTPGAAGAMNELHLWRAGTGAEQVPIGDNNGYLAVSLSADGSVAGVTYREPAGDELWRSSLYWSDSQVLQTVEELGFAHTASQLVLSGDGSTMAFNTEDTLVAEDVDSSTAYDDDYDWYFAEVPPPA
ncbi:hypothetical protein [Nocardioides sp. 503]|uniref:hypothetical protein n=1 Tax=Nocardioides sp. 503 TaxID=2508326 RepID=UPI00106FF8FA|nr:hypothetical protein [Nocardioides sp. 503]